MAGAAPTGPRDARPVDRLHAKLPSPDPTVSFRRRTGTTRSSRGPVRLEFVAIALYRIFIPFDADTGEIRNLKVAIIDSKWLVQNGIGPILPLQPMSRFGHTHQMRRRLR